MLIEVGLKKEAYTPEAFAYHDYLVSHGHAVRLCEESDMSRDADVRIYFMGMRPIWAVGRIEQGGVIHEYQSLSVPPCSRIKDAVKRLCNAVPTGRIFLNKPVQTGLSFSDGVPHIYRDMGVSGNLFANAPENPDYDILYCGSLSGRQGLLKELLRLASLGLRILVVGAVSDASMTVLGGQRNITLAGRLARQDLPQAFSSAYAGLNYTPDVFPFNVQTSTKTLEYCAAGLGVISNRYPWIEEFSRTRGFEPLWLDQIQSRGDLMRHIFTYIDVSDLEWGRVLETCGLLKFLSIISSSRPSWC